MSEETSEMNFQRFYEHKVKIIERERKAIETVNYLSRNSIFFFTQSLMLWKILKSSEDKYYYVFLSFVEVKVVLIVVDDIKENKSANAMVSVEFYMNEKSIECVVEEINELLIWFIKVAGDGILFGTTDLLYKRNKPGYAPEYYESRVRYNNPNNANFIKLKDTDCFPRIKAKYIDTYYQEMYLTDEDSEYYLIYRIGVNQANIVLSFKDKAISTDI